MSIIGITASKDYLYLVLTTADKANFTILQHHRFPVTPNNWPALLATLSSTLDSYNKEDAIEKAALVCCASGRFGASPEAFKAEGFAELKCQESEYPLSLITKKGLLKHLGGKSGQKWQAMAKELFNPDNKIKYFTSGYDAAISVAYGMAQ